MGCRRDEGRDVNVRNRWIIHQTHRPKLQRRRMDNPGQCNEKEGSGLTNKWSHLAGSYRGEMLGMLAVRAFLLAVKEYYVQAKSKKGDNKVACNNKGALFTFTKKSKRIPAASCNTDVQRALREANQRSDNAFKLKHVKGHQDRNKKLKNLPLEARLNMECDTTDPFQKWVPF